MFALIALIANALAWDGPLLTPEQQQQDFDEMWAVLDRAHPSLYLHTTEEELQRIRQEVRARLDEPRSPGVYWTVIMDALTPIGCGHTTVWPSTAALESSDDKQFPRDLVVVQGVLHIDPRTHDDAGRVVSIQGVPGDEVLTRIRGLINSDAGSTDFQDFEVDLSSPTYVSFLFDEPDTWELVVEVDGEEVAQTLDARTRFVRNAGNDPGERHREDRYEAHTVDLATGERAPFDKNALAGRALLLTFDGFDDASMKREIIKPLRIAAKSDVAGVIIDLRRNGGGSPWPAFEFFGHLIEDDELVYDQKLFRWPFYAEYVWGAGTPAYEKGIEKAASGWKIEDGLWDVGYGKNATVRARKPTYSGPVIVLTGGNTFSTGADMAALLKRYGRGTVIGTPSGGSGTLQTSGASVDLELTHSGVRVFIPLNRSRLVDPEGRIGRQGAPPDHRVERTFEQIRDDEDPAMDKALEVLRGG